MTHEQSARGAPLYVRGVREGSAVELSVRLLGAWLRLWGVLVIERVMRARVLALPPRTPEIPRPHPLFTFRPSTLAAPPTAPWLSPSPLSCSPVPCSENCALGLWEKKK